MSTEPGSLHAVDPAAAGLDAGLDTESAEALTRVLGLIRDVPDYPSPGIMFRDITPVLADAEAFETVATELAALVGAADVVVGIEARGFLIGAAVALVAGTGIVPVRKSGKLPLVAGSVTYELEYGTATLELPAETLASGARAFVVDDVLATGGTAAATCALLADAGVEVEGFGALLELTALGGRDRLGAVPVHALLQA
ncbi:adenine phosphoribosyltransferase [Actinomycetes bacterium KLBMP 9759]